MSGNHDSFLRMGVEHSTPSLDGQPNDEQSGVQGNGIGTNFKGAAAELMDENPDGMNIRGAAGGSASPQKLDVASFKGAAVKVRHLICSLVMTSAPCLHDDTKVKGRIKTPLYGRRRFGIMQPRGLA